MTNATRLPRFTTRAALGLGALTLLAACTSDGDPAKSTGPSSSVSGPATATSSSAAPSSSATSAAPAGFDGLDGAVLVLGPTRNRADIYRVRDEKIVRVTKSAGATTVASDDGRTVVGVDGPGDEESVRQLRGSKLTAIDADGFDPAVSSTGALARIRLESGSSTPGISKPGGFALVVRKNLSGRDRVVLTQKQSMGSPRWIDPTHIVVAAAGDTPRVLLVDVRSGARSELGTVAGADDLDLTASADSVAVTTDSGGVLIDVGDRNQHAFPKGWTPLCWPSGSEVLATRSGQLATVPVGRDGSAGDPRVLGPLPAGTSAYGASCGSA